MRFAAVGFTCIDVYKNLNISYPTGNGIDLMFNLMDLVPELVPSVVTAIGDDAYGQSMLEACQKRKVDTGHVTIVPGGQTAVIEMLLNGRDRVHHRAEKGVMIPYQPTGEDMDFIGAKVDQWARPQFNSCYAYGEPFTDGGLSYIKEWNGEYAGSLGKIYTEAAEQGWGWAFDEAYPTPYFKKQ